MMKMLKLGFLGLLVGAGLSVATATVGSEDTAAAPCCSSCEDTFESCNLGCAPGDTRCTDYCRAQYVGCNRRCVISC
jgi:hypothetical protein